MADQLPRPWIQTPPQGWLGFLGIKSGGKQPGHNSEDLLSTLDMGPFYSAGARRVLFQTPALAMAYNGAAAIASVPAGKVWIIERAVAMSSVLGALANAVIFIRFSSPGGALIDISVPSVKGITGEIIATALSRPIVLNPGDSIDIVATAPSAFTAFTANVCVTGSEVLA